MLALYKAIIYLHQNIATSEILRIGMNGFHDNFAKEQRGYSDSSEALSPMQIDTPERNSQLDQDSESCQNTEITNLNLQKPINHGHMSCNQNMEKREMVVSPRRVYPQLRHENVGNTQEQPENFYDQTQANKAAKQQLCTDHLSEISQVPSRVQTHQEFRHESRNIGHQYIQTVKGHCTINIYRNCTVSQPSEKQPVPHAKKNDEKAQNKANHHEISPCRHSHFLRSQSSSRSRHNHYRHSECKPNSELHYADSCVYLSRFPAPQPQLQVKMGSILGRLEYLKSLEASNSKFKKKTAKC